MQSRPPETYKKHALQGHENDPSNYTLVKTEAAMSDHIKAELQCNQKKASTDC